MTACCVRTLLMPRAILCLQTGEKYDGEWRNGLRHGAGRQALANGDVFVGTFKLDLQEGRGVLVHVDGSETRGKWVQGKGVGHGAARLRFNGPHHQPVVKVFGF